jgi:hypothetical protein
VERVVAVTAKGRVGPEAVLKDKGIGVTSADDGVVTRAPEDRALARPCVDDVTFTAPVDGVVAASGRDLIPAPACRDVQIVRTAACVDGIAARAKLDPLDPTEVYRVRSVKDGPGPGAGVSNGYRAGFTT